MNRFHTAWSVILLSWPLLVGGQENDPGTGYQPNKTFSGNSAFGDYQKKLKQDFGAYKDKVRQDFEEFAKLHRGASERYEKRISDVWQEPEQSSRTRWVHYDNGYRLKRVVDFDKRLITWSAPAEFAASVNLSREDRARQMLKELMSLTRQDAFEQDEVSREVEEKSRSQFKNLETASLDNSEPVIPAWLFGTSTVTKPRLNRTIDLMAAAGQRSTGEQKGQPVVSWSFPLQSDEPDETVDTLQQKAGEKVGQDVKQKEAPEPTKSLPAGPSGQVLQARAIETGQQGRLPARARPFVDAINRESLEFDVPAALLLAIMETESAFNPMAKSPIPAFGLMQIVPSSAGQDVTDKLYGKARLLAPSYLYNADNNIKVGSAYFNILYYRYFKGVENPVSRLYCAIAAYNTGPGNVSKALTGRGMKLAPAIRIVNTLTPDAVYDHLMSNLEYEETVNYLRKVTVRLAGYEKALSP